MSKLYLSLPKVNLSFPTASISYCVVSYKGNTTATSGNVISGNISTGTYTSRDLSFNTLYTFTLTPYSSLGLAGISKKVTVDTTPQVSGTKSSVKSTYDAATLQWSGTTYDNYTVSRSINSSSSYSDISTNIKTNYYYDNDLSGNTVYYYYVKPYDATGNPYPNATTISIYTNVRAPTDLSYTFLDSSGISLKWATKNSYATSYYNAAYVVNQSGTIISSVSGDIQTATIKDLSKNTTYNCYAQTYLFSLGNTITTSTATPYIGGNILLYNVSMNSISVSWSGQYYNRVAVYRRVGTLQSYTTLSGDDYASPYVDSDISGNTTYYYYVVPKISVFEGPSSSVVSATTPVAYPTDVSAIFYDTSAIQLQFSTPKNAYSTSVIYSAIAYNSTIGNTTVTGTSSPILIQNLSSSTTYTCYIKVTLDDVYTGTSSGLSVTTYAIPVNAYNIIDTTYLKAYYNFNSSYYDTSTGTNISKGEVLYSNFSISSFTYTKDYYGGSLYSPSNSTATTTANTLYIPLSYTLGTSADFTISFWVYCTAIASGTTYGCFICTGCFMFLRGYGSGTYNVGMTINTGSGGNLDMEAGGGLVNNWIHFVYTYTIGGNHKLYINNTLKASSSGTKNSLSFDTKVYFGGSPGAFATNAVAYYSHFRIYSTALTTTQIQTLYNKGV